MNLLTLFLISMTIAAICNIILFIVLIIILILTFKAFRELKIKTQAMIEESIETTEEARYYVNKVGKSMVDYFILKIRKMIFEKRKE